MQEVHEKHAMAIGDATGPTAYIVPRGWVRLGLALQPRAKTKELDVFNKWSTSFHGVKSKEVLKSILNSGLLMKSGDVLLDGSKLKSSKCAGRQDEVFYTSPTIRYAGLKFYAEPQRFDTGGKEMAASIALQCRQLPGSYEAQGETMRFSSWPGHLASTCPHTNLQTVEWKSERNIGTIPYGILVRVWPWGNDPEEREYSSPIDTNCNWHKAEQKAKVFICSITRMLWMRIRPHACICRTCSVHQSGEVHGRRDILLSASSCIGSHGVYLMS